uniref:(California timema) hypothetical protein n=1 Tax=Timema californicum TaxID=61474 RepID=A0A7R9J3C7_TIMCA|nr:unnamed protein product [Timema californicum]
MVVFGRVGFKAMLLLLVCKEAFSMTTADQEVVELAKKNNLDVTKTLKLANLFPQEEKVTKITELIPKMKLEGVKNVFELIELLQTATNFDSVIFMENFDTLALEMDGKTDTLKELKDALDVTKNFDILFYVSLSELDQNSDLFKSLLRSLSKHPKYSGLISKLESYLVPVPTDDEDALLKQRYIAALHHFVDQDICVDPDSEKCEDFRIFKDLVTKHTHSLCRFGGEYLGKAEDEDIFNNTLNFFDYLISWDKLAPKYKNAILTVVPYLKKFTKEELYDVYIQNTWPIKS